MNINDLRQICDDAQKHRSMVPLNIDFENGESIIFLCESAEHRLRAMHSFRRAGVRAWFASAGSKTVNEDKSFWGTKYENKIVE